MYNTHYVTITVDEPGERVSAECECGWEKTIAACTRIARADAEHIGGKHLHWCAADAEAIHTETITR